MTVVRGWVLVGENGTRKSSTIRCLTGLFNPNHRDIALKNGQKTLFNPQIRSLQENQDPEYSPEGFVDLINKEIIKNNSKNYPIQYHNLIIPLHYDPYKVHPEGIDYIRTFLAHNWTIESIISMGEPVRDWIPWIGCNYGEIPNSSEIPATVSASIIRKFWSWLG